MIALFYTSLFFKKSVTRRSAFNQWKVVLATLVLAAVVFASLAEAQTAQWVKQMGLGGISNGVSSDAAGNAYATGMVSNPGLFDNLVIPCNASDVFLAKYDAAGNVQWANVGGGDLLDQGNKVVTDAGGNSYVVGAIQTNSLHPTAKFDNITLTGNGDYDWLIVKYNTSGQVVWAQNYGSASGDIADGVALDAAGNVYVTGFFNGTMMVQGVTVTSQGLFDIFLAKLDANGTLLWLKTAGGTGSDQAHGVVVDGQGNVGITGEFQGTSKFDANSIKAAGLGDAFIAKYDAAGTNLWVHGGGSTTSFAGDPAKAIAVDGANNVFITGDYTGTAIFDGLSVPNTGTSGSDIFLAKYNSSGVIQWLHHAGGPPSDKGYSIGVDTSGNSWVTGFAASGPGVVFDTITLPPFGNEYIFLAKYDPAGVVQYVKQYAAGTGQDIYVLSNGVLYLNGGASKGNGKEFDDISLVYNDRGGFICQFSEPAGGGCEPPAGVMASNITSNTATISWSAVADASSYLLQYRKVGTNRWKTKPAPRTVVRLKNLASSTSYEYQVATVCATETSPHSAVQIFTTNL
ncbi:MAG: fibronectin type III domain-containing protein [Chthoniobacterales bacterium]